MHALFLIRRSKKWWRRSRTKNECQLFAACNWYLFVLFTHRIFLNGIGKRNGWVWMIVVDHFWLPNIIPILKILSVWTIMMIIANYLFIYIKSCWQKQTNRRYNWWNLSRDKNRTERNSITSCDSQHCV